MPSYTQLDDDRVVNELLKRGAKTFGSADRRAVRLDRFLKAEQKRDLAEKKAGWKRARSAEREIRRSDDEQYRQMVNEAFPGVVMPAGRVHDIVTSAHVDRPPPGGEPEYEPAEEEEYGFCAPILVAFVAAMAIHVMAASFTLAMWVGGQNGFSVA